MRRALDEPPDPSRGGGVLLALGRAGFAAQQPECIEYLREAVSVGEVPSERASAALQLGLASLAAGHATGVHEAVAAARRAGSGDRELELALDALELMGQSAGGVRNELDQRLERLGPELPGATASERTLLSRIAMTEAMFGHPVSEVLEIIPRALVSGVLEADELELELAFAFGAPRAGLVLAICNEFERSEELLGDYIERTRDAGLLPTFGLAAATRAIPAFRRGDLALAETSASDAREASDATAFGFWVPIALGMLVRVLLERGAPELAAEALELAPAPPSCRPPGRCPSCVRARGPRCGAAPRKSALGGARATAGGARARAGVRIGAVGGPHPPRSRRARNPSAAGRSLRARRAHGQRGARRADGRRWDDQQRDRAGAVRYLQDGRHPPVSRLQQTRDFVPARATQGVGIWFRPRYGVDQVTSRISRPRRTQPRGRGSAPAARSRFSSRSKIAGRTVAPIVRRAMNAPRHTCGPWPNATCPCEARRRSNASRFSQRRSSRLAEAISTQSGVPVARCTPETTPSFRIEPGTIPIGESHRSVSSAAAESRAGWARTRSA